MRSFQYIIDGIEPLRLSPPARDRAWDSLRFFALHICGFDDPRETPYRNTSFLHLPLSLTHLPLNLPWYTDFMGKAGDVLPSISLPNLTNLYIECDWPVTRVFGTVTSCKAVQTLTLKMAKSPHSHGTPLFDLNQAYPLHELQTSRLRSDEWWYTFSDILRPLVLPSLACLEIWRRNPYDNPEEEAPWVLEAYGDDVEALAQRSDSLVHLVHHIRLHFPKEEEGTVNLAPVLRRLPLAMQLTLDDTNFEDGAFQRGSQFLPHLQFLELVGEQPAFDYASLAEFCEERKSTHPSFAISRAPSPASRTFRFDDYSGWDLHM